MNHWAGLPWYHVMIAVCFVLSAAGAKWLWSLPELQDTDVVSWWPRMCFLQSWIRTWDVQLCSSLTFWGQYVMGRATGNCCNFTSVGIFCSCCLKQGWLLALWNKIQTCKQFIYFFKGMLILMRQCKQVHIFRICPFFKATKWHVNGDKWKYANLVRVCDEGQNWSPLYLY